MKSDILMKKESLTSKKTILTKPFMIEPSKRFDYKFSKNKFKTKSKGSSQHSSENYGQVWCLIKN